MVNSNTNYVQKPIFDGLLEQREYDAVLIKVTPMEARGNMPPSLRVMFKIDFPECVAFVSGFMNQFFKPGDKTSTWLKNLGVVATGNQVPVDQLKGKRCRIYVTPGNKVWSQNLNKEIQYHKIMALTPASSVVPQVIATNTQQQTQAMQTMVMPTQVQQPVAQPVYTKPMTQPIQNNPFVQPVQTVAQVQQPVMQPQATSMAEQLAKLATPVQQPTQQPVAQPVSQPLPVTPVSLDF